MMWVNRVTQQMIGLATNPKTLAWVETVLAKHIANNEDAMEEPKWEARFLENCTRMVEFLNDHPPGGHISITDVRNAILGEPMEKSHPNRVNTESPAFRAWFGNSKVVDFHGDPLMCFRGTVKVPKADKFMSRHAVPSFTALPDVASTYAADSMKLAYGKGSTVTPVFLSIQNPVVFHGTKVTLAEVVELLGGDIDDENTRYDLQALIRELERREYNGNHTPFNYELAGGMLMDLDTLARMMPRYSGEKEDHRGYLAGAEIDSFAIADAKTFVEWAMVKGYDGVIHRDAFDTGAKVGAAIIGKELAGLDSENEHMTYRPFHQNQIKSVFNNGAWSASDHISETAK